MNTLLLGGSNHEKIVNMRDDRDAIVMAVPRKQPDVWLYKIDQNGPTERDIIQTEVYRYSRQLSKRGGTPVFVHESYDSKSEAAFELAMKSYEYRTRCT